MGKDWDRNAWQRQRRKENSNAYTKKYEKTVNGKLMRTYRNMQSRVEGTLSGKAHLYEGLDIMPREDFYSWATNDPDFLRLYNEWAVSGYQIKLSPSINRIDTNLGYVVGNVEWLTHSENSSLGAISKQKQKEQSYG